MAKNDIIILDGIIDDRVEVKLPSNKRDEVFEYFSIEQILKDLEPSKEDIINGIIDGRNDGGIDSFYILVNGHFLTNIENFFWPKTNTEIEVYIITCKHHDTFKQAPLDNIVASILELFDLSIDDKDFKGDYNSALLKKRNLLKAAYRKVASRLVSFNINFAYASRGDSLSIGESIKSRADQITTITKQAFGDCISSFCFYGSTELINLNRKVPNFSLVLPFVEALSKGERYILLCKIKDYNEFISDDTGKLRRYLFDSNVRDFMGLNGVNDEIRATLHNSDSPDFWWLNNGVTILSTFAKIIGSTIHIEDTQIVNGLQTTESIYKYFSSGATDPNERAVLIKVIVSKEADVRDSIIRATNNQTNVSLSALRATDKIQRDIEDILLRNDLYYERRPNFYKNQGVPFSSIVAPLYLASGYLGLIYKDLASASKLKSKFMRNDESYERIFSEANELAVWPKIAKILLKTDIVLDKYRPGKNSLNEKFLKRWRYIVALITISRVVGSYNFNEHNLCSFDTDLYTENEIEKTWLLINSLNSTISQNSKLLSSEYTFNVLEKAGAAFGIKDFDAISHRKTKLGNLGQRKANRIDSKRGQKIERIEVSDELIEKVNLSLPQQPWKPGLITSLARQLELSVSEVSSAISVLVDRGVWLEQKDGIVYDKDHNIVAFDAERVDINSYNFRNK